ncbi:hypothetical protein NMY3_02627 [Candidatus Nitrosocosmicus oleophilus]|uniref:Uncharacterized protein n=1 Tax=Candidatus Nitrosocosmicus oleophilus TaxID=1353260 RepID=A0A654LZE5_9ARCH|nr:hypothetical protein NMY3_02627 [Candidatus Nitrosocosmicus oleophilus]
MYNTTIKTIKKPVEFSYFRYFVSKKKGRSGWIGCRERIVLYNPNMEVQMDKTKFSLYNNIRASLSLINPLTYMTTIYQKNC